MIFKSHIIFFLNNGNTFLGDIIFFYILFFTTSAFLFLKNLRYMSSYRYFQDLRYLDLIFLYLVIALFVKPLLVICGVFLFTSFRFARSRSSK
jgi:hypothetical protein